MVCVSGQCLRNNQAGGNFQWVRRWPRDKLCSKEPATQPAEKGNPRNPAVQSMESPE